MSAHVLSAKGTKLLLNGKPFLWQGLSFFNAAYNPVFNASDESRARWVRTFLDYGVNALRVWCQWDFDPRPHMAFTDTLPGNRMYRDDGTVRDEHFTSLARVIEAADAQGLVIEVVLFSHEQQPNLEQAAQERATREMAERLRPYRNVLLQIWNEASTNVLRCYEIAKSVDPERLVTNSPGFAGDLGDDAQNRTLDVLTPHTSRAGGEPGFWVLAAQEIASLLDRYGKPVIDDEPARTGLREHGGIAGGTAPEQHISQIAAVRALGAYHTYHHDMFQNDYGHPATPPSGIPEPEFRDFHRRVFHYLRDHRAWEVTAR